MRPATFDSPSDRNTEVSITTNPHPNRLASASTTVDLAVPGGPKRIALYDAFACSAVRDTGASADSAVASRPR